MVLTQEQFLISSGMPNISFLCEQLCLNTLCSFLFFSNIKTRVYVYSSDVHMFHLQSLWSYINWSWHWFIARSTSVNARLHVMYYMESFLNYSLLMFTESKMLCNFIFIIRKFWTVIHSWDIVKKSFVFSEAISDQLSSVIQFDHNWSLQLSKQFSMMKCMQLGLYLWISIWASMIILHTPKLLSHSQHWIPGSSVLCFLAVRQFIGHIVIDTKGKMVIFIS